MSILVDICAVTGAIWWACFLVLAAWVATDGVRSRRRQRQLDRLEAQYRIRWEDQS